MTDVQIFCADKEYGRALTENLMEECRGEVRTKLFTDPLKLNPQEVEDVFCVAEYDDFENWKDVINPEKTLFLTDSRECNYPHKVPKLSPVAAIASGLNELITEQDASGETVRAAKTETEEAKLIGFFSPVRRCSQTTLGLTVGNVLSEKRKVLYITFESFSTFWSYTGCRKDKTIEDLLLTSKISPEKFVTTFRNTVYHGDNMDILPPIKTLQQTLNVRAKEWMELINRIKSECGYDVIILDLSEAVHGLLDILAMCDQIYTVTADDAYSKAKINEYELLLSSLEMGGIRSKTTVKKVPYIEDISHGFDYKPFSAFAKYVRDMIMGDGLYARICVD